MFTGLIWIYLTTRDKHPCALGSPEQGSRFCLTQLLDSEATNPFEYEFSFHLEIRGPCLLAGRNTGAVLLHKADLSPPQGNVHTPLLFNVNLCWQLNCAGVDLPVQD